MLVEESHLEEPQAFDIYPQIPGNFFRFGKKWEKGDSNDELHSLPTHLLYLHFIHAFVDQLSKRIRKHGRKSS